MNVLFLCGYSYAWKVGYIPRAFEKLGRILIRDIGTQELAIKDRRLVQQIIDSYGKLGFLFLSRDYILQVNGKVPLSHIYVTYHLYNFIYDCKAFLDSVAIMLNDFYQIGAVGGNIDFKKSSFRNTIAERETKLHGIMEKHKKWFVKVVAWRDALIHKFSTIIAPSYAPSDRWPTDEELTIFMKRNPPCVMPMEPSPYLTLNSAKLKKYGRVVREIESFCQEWIDKACDLYDRVCDVISESWTDRTI